MSQPKRLVPPSHEQVAGYVRPFEPFIPRRSGFIRPYMEWAVTQTDAPAGFHFVVALSVLSAACPPRWGMEMGASSFAPNLFTMVIGRAGAERKSWSLKCGRELLRAVCPERVGDSPGSAEGLVASLAERPMQLIVEEELSRMLNQMQKGQYLETLKKALTDAFDGTPLTRALSKRIERVENYRLSFMGAINYSWFEQHTTPSDWEGGFIPRFLIVCAKRTRFLAVGEPDGSPVAKARRDALVSTLQRLAACPQGVLFEIDNETPNENGETPAYAFAQWCRSLDAKLRAEDESIVKSSVERAITPLSQKLATLFAIDRMLGEGTLPQSSPDDDPLRILSYSGKVFVNMDDVTYAARTIDYIQLESVAQLAGAVCYSASERMKTKVLTCIPKDGLGISWGDLLKATKMLRRELLPVVETLVDEGVLGVMDVAGPSGSQKRYIRMSHVTKIMNGNDGDEDKVFAGLRDATNREDDDLGKS